MSSYRKRTQSKPTTAAGLRAQASASGHSIFRNRPRSIAGLIAGSSQNSYSSLLGSGNSSTGNSFLSKSSPASSFLKSSYANSPSANGHLRVQFVPGQTFPAVGMIKLVLDTASTCSAESRFSMQKELAMLKF